MKSRSPATFLLRANLIFSGFAFGFAAEVFPNGLAGVGMQPRAPWGALAESHARAMAFRLLTTTAAGPLHLYTSPLSFSTGLKKNALI